MLVQRRLAPLAVGLAVARTGTAPAPISAFSTAPTAPASVACALGYSGCIGSGISGDQLASRAVSSLPSISPLRIAGAGRQKLYLYLLSKIPTMPSSSACAAAAKNRAVRI